MSMRSPDRESGRRWWAVVPMKDTRLAKSRLCGTPGERRQLAILMARDTLCAIANAWAVDGVVVIAQEERDRESFMLPGVRVVVRSGLGINDAIRAGVDVVRSGRADRDVAVLPGDLPYLRSSELDAALQRAAVEPRAVVADRHGAGTTLLTAATGVAVEPAYGPRSLRAHRDAGAVELSVPAWSGLRRDVDVMGDLAALGSLGRRTRTLLDRRAQRTPAEQVSA
jgi:2-phospho-L-lactate guanylyltransferase